MDRQFLVFRVCLAVALSVLIGWTALPLAAQTDSWLLAATGPYQIGTTSYHWVDKARDELSTDDPDDKRELVVVVWYPAEVGTGASPVSYFRHDEADVQGFEASQAGAPFEASVSVTGLASTPTHSYLDAPLSSAQDIYPVLIYSPGAPGMPEFATAHIEELVSNGYVVVAINHPYFSGWTQFPDGRMVTSTLWQQADSDPAFVDLSVEIGAQDQTFVLDQLAMLNADDPESRFSGRLNLETVGTFGTSWGAWVAGMAGLQDERLSVVLLEGPHGTLPNTVVEQGFDQPIMFMDSFMEPSISVYLKMSGPAFRLNLSGISGWSFADFALWPGFPEQELGDVAPPRAAQIVNIYALAFLDRYLKNEAAPLLDDVSPDYSEVEVSSRNM